MLVTWSKVMSDLIRHCIESFSVHIDLEIDGCDR